MKKNPLPIINEVIEEIDSEEDGIQGFIEAFTYSTHGDAKLKNKALVDKWDWFLQSLPLSMQVRYNSDIVETMLELGYKGEDDYELICKFYSIRANTYMMIASMA